jgi:serine/alanine adding enzyme
MKDIFFEPNYGRLYEKIENGTCEVFEFAHPLGTIQHLFIKREVPGHLLAQKYYDIVTPYGYGGPLITDCPSGRKAELVHAFEKAFSVYCNEQGIIAEFIRFHPLLGNAKDFKECYSVKFLRHTVGTNLKDFDDPVQEEFSKSTRKAIRHALRIGATYRVTVNPQNLDTFTKLYLATMKRVGADSYYYFDAEYFSRCLEYFGERIVLVEALYEGQVIGAELHFFYNNFIHTHLSGTLDGYHHLSPVYVMTFAIAEWGKANGADFIHAGGGTTNEPDDSLYLFKKKFGHHTEFDFFVGRRVWNPAVYTELCTAAGAGAEEEFFPAYRSCAVKKTGEMQQAD